MRVLVYGVTGSGKSTLAKRLGAITGLPVHLVDDLTWEPGWTPVAEDEQRRRILSVCARERWILDSAYGGWLDVPLGRADLIVALDYARWRSLGRLLLRTGARVVGRREVCNGNRETLRTLFSAGSIVLWHFRSITGKRRRMRSWATRPSGATGAAARFAALDCGLAALPGPLTRRRVATTFRHIEQVFG